MAGGRRRGSVVPRGGGLLWVVVGTLVLRLAHGTPPPNRPGGGGNTNNNKKSPQVAEVELTLGAARCPTATCACSTVREEPVVESWRHRVTAESTVEQLRASALAEMEASVERQHPALSAIEDVRNLLAKVLWRFDEKIDHERSDTVLISDNRLIVDERFFNVTSSHAAHLTFVLSVMRRRRLSNVAYRLIPSQGSCATHRFGPHLLFAKARGYCGCGTLIPNPYLGRDGNLTRWEGLLSKLAEEAARRPYGDRTARAVWRGQIRAAHVVVATAATAAAAKRKNTTTTSNNNDKLCEADYGNGERLKAIALGRAAPGRFDIRCVTHCAPAKKEHLCGGASSSSSSSSWGLSVPQRSPEEAAVAKLLRSESSSAFKGVRVVTDASHRDPHEFVDFKYVLGLPGGSSTSYSPDVNFAWALEAAVLLWDSPHREWYHAALAEGETHLTVNASTAHAIIGDLEARAALQRRLRLGAAKIRDAFFTPDALARYFSEVVLKLRSTFAYDVVLDSHKETGKFLQHHLKTTCRKLRLVEVLGETSPNAPLAKITGISSSRHPVPFKLRALDGCTLTPVEDAPVRWAGHSTAPLKMFFEQQLRLFDNNRRHRP